MNPLIQWFFLFYFSLAFKNAEPLVGYNISPARPHEFSFIASLTNKNGNAMVSRGHFCTGSLISKKSVITAAHCLVHLTTSQVIVIIGEVNLTRANSESTYDVKSWITYVDWATKRGKALQREADDVAIVKLARPVMQEGIIPVKLINLNILQLDRTNGTVAGWGITNGGTLSDVLLEARVTILPHKTCEEKFKRLTNLDTRLYTNHLCSAANPYTLISRGDSGGPLLDENKFLLGIGQATCPKRNLDNLHPEFVNQYKFNVAVSIDFCRDFIEEVAKINTRSN